MDHNENCDRAIKEGSYEIRSDR